jgi:hypothetical protein
MAVGTGTVECICAWAYLLGIPLHGHSKRKRKQYVVEFAGEEINHKPFHGIEIFPAPFLPLSVHSSSRSGAQLVNEGVKVKNDVT